LIINRWLPTIHGKRNEIMTITLQDRYRGSLLGLAAGDALGTTLEFCSPGSFEPITDIVGGGPFNLQPGQSTDDTSMALCLAESLIECNGFDATDAMQRFVDWWRHGHLSCTGDCFDIGIATRTALSRFEHAPQQPFAGSDDPRTAGNGSIMRLAPIPLFFAQQPHLAIEKAAESSRLTHGATECVDACRYLAALIVGAFQGRGKDELLADHFDPTGGGLWTQQPLCPRIDEIAAGSFRCKEPPEIRGGGYVVESLEATLWAFERGEDFADVVLRAANLGDDSDTTSAVAGQLAGAFYGVGGIPEKWLTKLAMRKEIDAFAVRLFDLAAVP
jgi:ADP-ribosyl-[dinitrogen reductase] hydrolase